MTHIYTYRYKNIKTSHPSTTALAPAAAAAAAAVLSVPGCCSAAVPPAVQPWPASGAPSDSGSPSRCGPSCRSAPPAPPCISHRPAASPAPGQTGTDRLLFAAVTHTHTHTVKLDYGHYRV